MTDFNNYIKANDTTTTTTPTKTTITIAAAAATTAANTNNKRPTLTNAEVEATNNGCSADDESETIPLVLKSARPNSKLILRNMEEVLNSVKKRHRQKHRRKKEQQKKLAHLEEIQITDTTITNNIDNAQQTTTTTTTTTTATISSTTNKMQKTTNKQPLQEMVGGLENGLNNTKVKEQKLRQSKSPLKNGACPAKAASILEHFQRTPKKTAASVENDEELIDVLSVHDVDSIQTIDSTVNAKKLKKSTTSTAVAAVTATKLTTNAFEVMMNARNKSIGTNTPGKEAAIATTMVTTSAANEISPVLVKRKLVLQEWAERKGGAKRKIEEETRAAYIEQQLENRAKRFKQLLVNGANSKATTKTTPQDKREKTKENRKAKNATKIADKSSLLMRTKSRGRKRRQRHLSFNDSIESFHSEDEQQQQQKQQTQDLETVDFLSKLSSPTKKKDNLLGYFQKKESTKEAIAGTSKVNGIIKNEIKVTKETTTKAIKAIKTTTKTDEIDVEAIDTTPTRATATAAATTANEILQESPKLITAQLSSAREMPKEFIIKEIKIELKKTKDSAISKLQMQQQEKTETPKRHASGGGGSGRKKSKAKLQTSAATIKETTTNLNDSCAKSISTPTPTPTSIATVNATSTPTSVPLDNNITTSLSSRRPRRSCAGKARYDYDLDVSPTKTIKATIAKQTQNNDVKNESIEVITLDDSSLIETPNTSKTTTTKRLAPLFVRALPKPSPDPVAIKARQDFLHSGVPEKIRLEMEKQKLVEQHYEETYETFPKVSHIQQLNEPDQQIASKSEQFKLLIKSEKLFELDLPLATTATKKVTTSARKSKGSKQQQQQQQQRASFGSITNLSTKDWRSCKATTTADNIGTVMKPSKIQPLANSDKRSIIKSWKVEFERFPTFKCYNQMCEKYQYFSAIDSTQDTQQLSESFVMTRSTRRPTNEIKSRSRLSSSSDVGDGVGGGGCNGEEKKPPVSAPNGELLFTEKYKPMLFEQVLVNLTPVMQLRDFLANWSNGSKLMASNGRNSQDFDDSFEVANDSNSSQQISCNSVVLLGPVSSGKTNAVFALANEMNFNVLEINAGMKRTGKKMIQELQEATQSHQIRKESTLATTNATGTNSKSQNQLLQRMSLNGFKTKKKSTQSLDGGGDSSSSLEQNQGARKSLILIEDADIVFEQTDAGFIDAIYTLAASSKRPVIVVASNPNCQHLQRLMQQNTINFNSQNVLNISKFLAILSLMENCPILLDDLISLYLFNRKDLRRTLLELQFFIQSGGDRLEVKDDAKSPQNNSGVGTKIATPAKMDIQFFASPTKRRFSVEPNIGAQNTENDDKLDNETQKTRQNNEIKSKLYKHNTLFDFYTIGQNERLLIPFPVDFYLLRVNLSNIFEVSTVLKDSEVSVKTTTINTDVTNVKDTNTTAPIITDRTARKSRSPKKAWLNSANVVQQKEHKEQKQLTSLDSLCTFYENISAATLLGTKDADAATAQASTLSTNFSDRLVPHLAEDIAHELVQKSINVNLEAQSIAYNLFDTPIERQVLSNYISAATLRTKRAQNLDYEPHLRAICRSEKQRSMQERRSTRFYHYLRNMLVNMGNFSTSHFESACAILQQQQQQQQQQQTNAEKTQQPQQQQQQINNNDTTTTATKK